MSRYGGLDYELWYSWSGAGAAINGTSESSGHAATQPVARIPAEFLRGGGSISRSVHVVIWGQMTCGSTATNATFQLRLMDNTTTWANTGISVGATAATAMTVSTTAAIWKLEADIIVRTESGVGGASTIFYSGLVSSPAGLGSPFAASIPATNVAITNATIDPTHDFYLYLSGLVSQTTGAPSITLQGMKVYLEN